MATDHGVLTMKKDPNILQLVDEVKAIFDANLIDVKYVNSSIIYPLSAFDSLDNWLISFSPKCDLKSYLLTIDSDQLTGEQTEHLIESVFGDNEDDKFFTVFNMKARKVLELISEDVSTLHDKVMSLLFSLYEG
jgi:hypothetical protein